MRHVHSRLEELLKVSLLLEILEGCKWNCSGCYINKKEKNLFCKEDLVKIKQIVNSFKRNNYKDFEFYIGPTDIFTADNRSDILQDATFIDLVKNCSQIGFMTTLIELDEELLRFINENYPRKLTINFNIIIDLSMFRDDFLLKIKSNILRARSLLNRFDCVYFFPQMNLFNVEKEELKSIFINLEYITELSKRYFGEGIDFAISFGRRNLDKSNQRKIFRFLKDIYNNSVTKDNFSKFHFDLATNGDLRSNVLTYKKQKLFAVPLVYEPYVTFDPRYEIHVQDWGSDEIAKKFFSFQDNLRLKQYEMAKDYPCGSCSYLSICVGNGVVDFLEFIEMKECIFPRKAFNKSSEENSWLGKVDLSEEENMISLEKF